MKRIILSLSLALCCLVLFAVVPHNPKRGVAFNLSSANDLKALSGGSVSWWYNWGTSPNGGVESIYQASNLDYVPMIWGPDGTKTNFDDTALRAYLSTHPNVKYLLGFNEPNFNVQSNTTPQQAAAAWPKLEKVAKDFGLKLVSPAVNYSPDTKMVNGVNINDPFEWLTQFFAACPNCQIDYVACHSYMNTSGALIWYVNQYAQKFGKPVWLTEFCGWDGGISASAQETYLRETTASFDANPNVFRYAWFFGRDLYTAAPYSSLFTAKSGELSKLGKIYCNLEDVVDPNAPQVINNAVTLKVIDKTKGVFTNSVAWPNQSVYAWLGMPNNNWTNVPNGAGDSFGAAGFYNGLPGGHLVKTETEWTWSFSFEALKNTKYQWNPGVFADAKKTENPFTKMAMKLNGGADLIFNIDGVGKATGQLTVVIESADLATSNSTETQVMSTVSITKPTTALGESVSAISTVNVFPNPANDLLNVDTQLEVKSVALIDLSGVTVLKRDNQKVVDLSGLDKGLYTVDIELLDGERIFKKLIKN